MSNKCQTQPNITRCTSSESFIFILCVICDWLQCPTALFAYVTILNNNNIKYRVGEKYQETDHQSLKKYYSILKLNAQLYAVTNDVNNAWYNTNNGH